MKPTLLHPFKSFLAVVLVTILWTSSAPRSFGQIAFPPQAGGFGPATNMFGPVPGAGLLIVDYNFYNVPDTMEVYFGGAQIFNSGLVSGLGQFSIPYGPGPFSELTIIMNREAGLIGSVWDYTPLVAVPEPAYHSLLGLGLAAWVWRGGSRIFRRSGPPQR